MTTPTALKFRAVDKDGDPVWTVGNRIYPTQAPPTARIDKFKAYDHDGNALAGGKVHTYEAGTSTEYTTYSDPGLTVPNDNPVILDANGEADIYCENNYHPKLVLKDSNDVLYWTIDYYLTHPAIYLDETIDPEDPDFDDLSTANKMSFSGALTYEDWKRSSSGVLGLSGSASPSYSGMELEDVNDV